MTENPTPVQRSPAQPRGKPWRLVLLAILLLALSGVLLSTAVSRQRSRPTPLPPIGPDERAVALASNKFGMDFYARLKRDDENSIFSPYGLFSVLAPVYAGARGDTALQTERALHLGLTGESFHSANGALNAVLAGNEEPRAIDLGVRSKMEISQSVTLLPEFLSVCKEQYRLEVETVPQPPGVAFCIKNEIRFEGRWATPFLEVDTQEMPFQLAGGRTAPAPLMHALAVVGYLERPDYQVAGLTYSGNEAGMIVFLPRSPDNLATLEASLTLHRVVTDASELIDREVDLYLPSFRIDAMLEAPEILQALGMTAAFSQDTANLTGISERRPLWIDRITQRASVEVTEQGTKATAVTELWATLGEGDPEHPPPPPVFRADRPFFFLIVHRTTGCILFLGRFVDPRKT